MALQPSSPVTGAAISGLTSPTYTIAEDQASVNARRFLVTALGGTQTGVETHSIGSPFYTDVSRPMALKSLPRANPSSGLYPSLPVNEFRVKTLKGATVVSSANQEVVLSIETRIRVVAGVDLSTNDPEEINAMLSYHIGFLSQNGSGIRDMVVTGALKG